MKELNKLLGVFTLLILVGACKKDPPLPPDTPAKYDKGILTLNEGLFEQNNASLSFYDGTTEYQLVFNSENQRGLGDTANDFEAYDYAGLELIIIAVDVSSQVEIINRRTLESIAQIPLFKEVDGETIERSPRRVAVKGFNAYVCNFDGTVAVIDLINYSVDQIIEVGANPDGMLFLDDKLYVSNSGGLLSPVYDSTISVIDLATNTVVETIETRINCSQLVADNEGDIYLLSRGNYMDIEPAMLRINTTTNMVEEITEKSMSSMTIIDDWMYFYDSDAEGIYRYHTLTESFEEVEVINCAEHTTFYGFHYDEYNNRFYTADANGYVNSSTIRAFDIDGTFLFEFQAGLNATDIIVNN